MNEKNYKKRLDFQQKVISKKTEEIESLKLENEKLKQKIKEKDEIIASVEPMRKEMTDNTKEYHKLKEQYKTLVQELKQMKEIMNKTVFKGRWKLIKFLLR